MASRKLSAALAVAGIALAVVLFVALQDDEDADAPSPPPTQGGEAGGKGNAESGRTSAEHVVTILVLSVARNGQPVGGVAELEFAKGERIRFIVESEIAEEVHLHGYDIAKDVEPGGKVEFNIPATIEGVFEVELEHSAVPLAEISVTPA